MGNIPGAHQTNTDTHLRMQPVIPVPSAFFFTVAPNHCTGGMAMCTAVGQHGMGTPCTPALPRSLLPTHLEDMLLILIATHGPLHLHARADAGRRVGMRLRRVRQWRCGLRERRGDGTGDGGDVTGTVHVPPPLVLVAPLVVHVFCDNCVGELVK